MRQHLGVRRCRWRWGWPLRAVYPGWTCMAVAMSSALCCCWYYCWQWTVSDSLASVPVDAPVRAATRVGRLRICKHGQWCLLVSTMNQAECWVFAVEDRNTKSPHVLLRKIAAQARHVSPNPIIDFCSFFKSSCLTLQRCDTIVPRISFNGTYSLTKLHRYSE